MANNFYNYVKFLRNSNLLCVSSLFVVTKPPSPVVIVLSAKNETHPTSPNVPPCFPSQVIQVKHLFISAAPELMAYSAVNESVDGFIYITASHNPVGHNGLKFANRIGVAFRLW